MIAYVTPITDRPTANSGRGTMNARRSNNWLHACVIALLALSMLAFSITAASAEGGYTFIDKWGSQGSGDGQFYYPFSVAVDSSGNVFVVDRNNHRIQKFDSSGNFIDKWGSYGNGDGQFYHPSGVAVDSSGNVFVADRNNHRIQKFDSSGSYITKWGSYGTGDGQLDNPSGVAVDSSGNVFVVDRNNHRIQKFDSSGNFITKWGSEGSGDGAFYYPYGIVVDSSGNVFVVEMANNRIQKFDSSGSYITKWGSYGTGDGQLDTPSGVAVDSSGNVFVVEMANNRIQKFDSSGSYITKWGSYGNGDGQFYYPFSVAVDSSGNVFVADSYNHRIQKFSLELISVSKTASPSSGAPSTNVNFTIVINNTGPYTLNPVKVVDTLPSGMSYVSSLPEADTHGETAVTWNNIGSLPSGDSMTLYLNLQIDSDASGILINTVNVMGTPPTGSNGTDSDTSSVTVNGPTLKLGSVTDVTQDWGQNFNLNHSVMVTNATASNVNVTYNVSWITDNNTMGMIAQDGIKWHNQTLSNSTVQEITVRVDANTTTASATNDSEIFLLNITRRNIDITSQPESTQSVGTDTTFWINASANDEHEENLICKADLIREGVIIGNQTISGGNVNFSMIESTAGTFNFSVRFYNTSHYDNASTINSTVTVRGPSLTLDNVDDITRDWGRNFDLNHSLTVTNAIANNVNLTYNVSWITDNNTMGTIAQDGIKWHNQTLSNSTVQEITVRVDANTTTASATNDSEIFLLNITRRNIDITSQPESTQSIGTDTTFWINASANDEHGEDLICKADLIREGVIIGNQTISNGNVNFSRTESTEGTFNFSVRFYNTSHYDNASTSNSTVTVSGPSLTLGNVDNVASDWGRYFNLNHSVTVTNATASNVNVTYNVSWILNNDTMGTMAQGGMKWHNQTFSNLTVQKITVKVDATSTTGSATNASETFSINITRRNIDITSQPESTQSVGTDTTFWINASANDEHEEDLICKGDLIREGVIIGNQTISGGNVNFSMIESTAGTFNFSVRFYNTSHYDNKSTSNSTVTVRGPTLALGNVDDITRDWGKSFNLNHSITVTNATASNVNVTYNVSWILNNATMGTIAEGGMKWHNQSLSNLTVQNITVKVDATSTTGSATNDSEIFLLNITRRNMEITSQPKPAQTVDPDTTFHINASARDKYGDILIGTADLIKDGTIIESQDISSGNVNFSRTEPLAGTFNFSIRFYNLTHYNNASTSNSSVNINGPTLAISNILDITRDWGRNFNLNHSVTVTNATATNVNLSYNVSWLTECTLGTVNKDATGWGNQTVSNSTVQRITARVNANSTNTSTVNDTDTFQVNITKRDINITSYPPATKTVNPGTTFWINATAQGEYAENFIGNATLVRDGIVVGTPKAVTDGNASFNQTESLTGTYKFSIRFNNLTYYFNASTDNSTVSVENPPSSSGGSSSGGGVGTSDEPENVEETVFLRIYLQAGDSSTYNFDNVVTSVEVTPERTYGLVAAKIEVLHGQPGSITTNPPAGVLYKYVNIFVGTSGWYEGKFSSSVINFQLPISWFEDNNIDPASVTLYRHYGDEWQSLATTMTGQAGEYYQYSAPTPGFSTFMILGQVEDSGTGEPVATPDSGTVADPTPTPEAASTSDKGIPGFGLLQGIMGVLIAVYSRKK